MGVRVERGRIERIVMSIENAMPMQVKRSGVLCGGLCIIVDGSVIHVEHAEARKLTTAMQEMLDETEGDKR